MSQVATSPIRENTLNWWFLWKETRQLLPLVVLLFLVTALLIVSQAFLSRPFGIDEFIPEFVFLIFPGLFATGAGAVMVGQEREHGTIDWLSSLPITPRRLILTKLTIATFGLIAMWIVAFVCMELFSTSYSSQASWRSSSIRSPADGVRYPMLIAHSVVVLLSGFYASWQIKDQFQALCVLVALAFLPLVVSEIVTAIVNPGNRAIQSQSLWLVSSLILIPIIGLVGYRTAMKALLPQAAPKVRVSQAVQTLPAVSLAPQAPTFESHVAPIAWQFIHATPILLGGLTLALIAGVVIPPLMTAAQDDWSALRDSPAVLLLLVAPISWLGVAVFKNDASSQRIRFLADRGVNPTMIYLGRHAVPIALIAAASLLYAAVATLVVMNHHTNGTELLPSLTMILLFFAVVYSFSQWVSQLIRTLVLAVILAPVVSGLAVGWFFETVTDFGTPIWNVLICASLPMIATWWMMNRYVDSRDRLQSCLLAIVVGVAIIALPVMPVLFGLTRFERMSASQRTSLQREGLKAIQPPKDVAKLRTNYWQTDDGSLHPPFDKSQRAEWATNWIGKDSNSPETFLSSLDQFRKDPSLPAEVEGYFHTGFLYEFMLQRLKFEESPDHDKQLAEYESWLSATAIVARALRNGRQQLNQERADLLEIALIDALLAAAMEPYRSDDEIREIATILPSVQQRNAQRRAAILADWVNQRAGFYYARSRHPVIMMQLGGMDRHQEAFVVVALDALKGASTGGRSWQRRLHDLVALPSLPFELGPYSSRFRDQPAMRILRTDLIYPCRYWGMQWESDIQKLKDSFRSVESQTSEVTE